MGSLPLPPNVQGPMQGPMGQQTNPGYAPGAIPGSPQGMGQQVVGGIVNFVNSYLQGKEAAKEHNKKKFFSELNEMMLGIPKGDKEKEKMMKYAQKAGMNLPTEAPTPEEQQYQQAQQVSQAGPIPGMPGVAEAAAQVPAAPARQEPSLMQRFLQSGLGIGLPKPSLQSPAANWINQIQAEAMKGGGGILQQMKAQHAEMDWLAEYPGIKKAMSKIGLEGAKLDLDKQQKLKQLFDGAMSGNPAALEMATRSGIMKELPVDEMTILARRLYPNAPPQQVEAAAANMYLYGKMGGPQMALAKIKMAQDLSSRFGGDLAQAQQYVTEVMSGVDSKLKPSWTPEEYEKILSGTSKISADYPTAPWSLTSLAGMAGVLPGGKELLPKVMEALSRYPRNGTIQAKEFQQKLGFDFTKLSKEMKLQYDQLDLAKWKAVQEQLGQEGKMYMETLSSDKSSSDAKKKAAESLANVIANKAVIKLDYQGQKLSVPTAQAFVQGWGLFGKGGLVNFQNYVGVPNNPSDLYKRSKEEHQAIKKVLNPLRDPERQKLLDQLYGPMEGQADEFEQEGAAINQFKQNQQDVSRFLTGR